MKTKRTNSRRNRGYTLIEALVAGVILMGGISAASQLTLTLLTQEEMNRRIGTALNIQENAATLFRIGFDETEIGALLPPDPVVDKIDIKVIDHDLGGTLGNMEYAEVKVEYNPAPADENYTSGLWTSGKKDTVISDTVSVFRSVPPLSVE